MMNGVEFKELFKVAVETLREKTITPLLEADVTYQEDSDNGGIAEMHYLQLDLTEEQRKVCNRLLECRDKQDIEYATHAYSPHREAPTRQAHQSKIKYDTA